MLTRKYILSTALACATASFAYSQDLLQHVPQEAELVLVVNNQAIVKHSSFEKINAVLHKLGAFEAFNSQQQTNAQNINDLDIAYDRNAYVYKTDTDSAYYVGIWLPLKNGHHIEQIFSKDFTLQPAVNNFQRATSADKQTQFAWNANSLFILTGSSKNGFFSDDEVANRYGIEPGITTADDSYWYSDTASAVADYDYYADTVVAADSSYYEWTDDEREAQSADEVGFPPPALPTIVDTVSTDWEAYSFDDTLDIKPKVYDEYAVDSATSEGYYEDSDIYDSYSDDMYQEELARNAMNDSIQKAAFASWLANTVESQLVSEQNVSLQKEILQFDKNNTLLHLWVKDLNNLYRNMLPYDVFRMGFGIDMKNLDYGYKDATLDLIQDKHTLKVTGAITVDDDVKNVFNQVYKTKVNRKFAKYIPEKHLGYLSINISTEGYLKSLPTLMNKWYAPLVYSYSDLISIAGTALDIALDEKALAKVIRGNHLVFINDLKKVTTEYIDYEYDEDYNYKEVKKTKEEEIPNFLWMLTSEDQRIFKGLLAFAEKKKQATQDNGIYKISEKPTSTPFYILFKEDIIFVGNDETQIKQIQNNTFVANRDPKVKKDIFSNSLTATVHTSEIPEVINKLGVPIVGQWHNTVNELAKYGDVSIKAKGMKKNKINGEFSIDFPKEENNALQYLLQYIITNVDSQKGF
ncbi:hypothetical protein [Sphingobacterium sp. LRF_L2]|uniref:hypothetical protein n=1 Tax=Sphingobacterium sp. LRF_L2 TaxID=3369421 RepID=UPI003F5E583B